MQQSMILGFDFLTENGAIIDCPTNTLFIPEPDTDEKLVHSVELNNGLARTKRHIHIKALHQVDIPDKVSNLRNQTALLEPLHTLPNQSLAGAKCIVQLDDTGNSYMRLMNPTEKTIHLPANFVVASVSAVESKSITSLTDTHVDKKTQNSKTEGHGDILGFDFSNSDLSEDQKTILQAFLSKNRQVFAKDLSELGNTDLYKHTIDTGDAPPIRKRFYRQSPPVLEEMNKQIDKMLKHGIIEESNSEWAAPVVMCKKKSGELRFCCDFRSLNKLSRPKFFPLPRMEDVLDSLGRSQAQIFTTLDLLSGYWQCQLDPATAHKSAFVTPSGVYQWKRLPFGLSAAPSSFQHLLTQVLHCLNYQIALVYVDDILVYSRTFEDHLKHLQLVFDRLKAANLTLKPSKCQFARKEVIYLGHKVSKKGVEVDKSKIETVESFPVPTTEKQVRSFLGLCNYYRKFVQGYSHIAGPLHNLTKDNVPFQWTKDCQVAFDKLKKTLISSPILAYPDMSKDFILTTDASGTAIGYFLAQLDSEGQEKVIAYGGRSLTEAERKWSASEHECLAILEGVKTYHVYLAYKQFKVYTDHNALKFLNNIKQSTGRLARWSVLLQGYDMEILYRQGKTNVVADCLSRREYPVTKESDISEPEDVIPSIHAIDQSENPFLEVTFVYSDQPQSTSPLVAELTTSDIIPIEIGKLQSECPDFSLIYEYVKNNTLPDDKKIAQKIVLEASQYIMQDDVLYHQYQPRQKRFKKIKRFIKQLALPRTLRNDLMKAYHDHGHFGFDRTYQSIQEKYYFPRMYQVVTEYIRGCEPCQKQNIHHIPKEFQ
ncbi:unnamed protein product [Mytilus coruscus]|uniref:Reverse transcriptase domain-containing protein n=1 Tax=Mytilus coruscus TaxID=42192 RepID=A0A6J8DRR4_MYTCO|nr:unnamed protein product [Mytilus coruscus]